MKLTLSCPKARYGQGMAIFCQADGGPCGHQYYKSCKGWWALTEGADKCTRRDLKGVAEHGANDEAGAERADAV